MVMRRSLLGATALAVGALGGTVLGYLAERTVLDPVAELTPGRTGLDNEGHELRAPDGTRLTLLASGPADADIILLVHGLSLTHEIWDGQRAVLNDRYRVVTLDMRGHGDSDDALDGDYSTVALGGDVIAALDSLGGQRCMVVGHSMGGMAVLAALQARPDLMDGPVAGVGLVNSAAAAVISGLRGGWVAAGIAFARERARSTLTGRIVFGGVDDAGLPRGNDLATLVTRTLGVGPHAPDQAVSTLRRLILDSRPHVAGEMWRTAGTVDLLDAAAAITVPVLIIGGAHDRVLPMHHSRRLAEVVADAEVIELPEVGHVAMMERPHRVTALLDRFAGRVFAGARR